MLEDLASSRFGFWIVALIMVVVDSSFLLKPGKFAFSVSSSNLLNIRISLSPFLIRNKELACSLLSFPLQAFFISDIEVSKRATARETFKELSRLRRIARQNWALSALSAAGLSLLIVGPCLAGVRGVQTSILFIFPLFYLLALASSVLLWRRRRRFGLSKVATLKIAAEMILCPILLVNISKRISLAQKLELNTYRLAIFSGSPGKTLAAIRENVRFHSGG